MTQNVYILIFLNLYLRPVRKVAVTKHTSGYAVSRFHHWASGWDFGKRSGFSEFWRSDQLLSSLQMLELKSDVYVCNLEESVIQTRYIFMIFTTYLEIWVVGTTTNLVLVQTANLEVDLLTLKYPKN